jgi:hypothetical protein
MLHLFAQVFGGQLAGAYSLWSPLRVPRTRRDGIRWSLSALPDSRHWDDSCVRLGVARVVHAH